MSKKSEYVVTSETTRVEEGRPDLCWMNIGVDKLDRCCKADEAYYFQCDIDGEQFEFCKKACKLRDAFVREDVYKKTNVGGTSYNFYLDYRKGVIYKSKTKRHSPVILLDPVGELHLPEGVNQTTKRKPAMKKKPEYVVTSKTTRVEEGRPDLCWMNIDVDKLDRCCKANGVYYFQCDIDGEQFEFCKKACELRDAFVREDVYKKINVRGTSYNFFLDYQKGAIYKSETKGLPPVILLNPVGELHLLERVNQTTKTRPSMNKKPEYVVTSETTRVEEGRPDLCWMDIGVDKLDRCCEANGVYYFQCDIGGVQFEFCRKACELRDAFVREDVYKKTNAGGTSYSFYLDYREGVIYKSKTKGHPPVILLNPLRELHLLERVNQATKTRPSMNKKPEYVVTSETPRVKEGHPDLCWMDINVDKLDRCCEADEVYYFQCDIRGKQYKFYTKARKLKDAFVKKDVYKKKNKGGIAYSFYLDYRKGVIYKSKTKVHLPVIFLNPVRESE